ncbi:MULTISPECIES: benzoate/H(+) symporter BenE family transporter [Legionella]|uniref:Benzoate transporter BenE n=1 Tax=Legionella septentrionalis TaxID=2498109 RepID=A0A3S0V6D5_9GAMM|nr:MULTISPECIES: benzoate/H(+) symporter BenE family transporter [Legionella]MCP0913890.1 benzoate/H(+) symporter BenE family transporter [Legionella sp. 27cVA30]RUQ90441.1 benzoate transporter BenE [Legionella septentrionalis]RUQ94684.1 benzoate transporter BenE [Legionella septentrionalis]RUR10787.1 benzoate transporter BenE [Legionella septentrionalis]RUR16459.1 benzoate transporter BenE [Legionella septentrionalis]
MFKYFSIPNMTAGFVGVMVGFTSSAVLVFQAATAAGANQAEISSWLLALGLSLALTCIGLSLRYRIPILVGWSTPGAALLATSLTGISMAEAVGAFIFSAILTILAGVTGVFEKMMAHIPRSLASAMLAGILLQFGISIFTSMQHEFALVCTLLIAYLIGKRLFPRYVILLVLILGIAIAWQEDLFHFTNFHLALSYPIFTVPVFNISTLISIGLPLFIVTMTSQNVPGTAVMKANGYQPPLSPVISWIGVTTLFFAPFGCYSINLAAITAAICTGSEADSNPLTRYKATVFAGLCWILIGLFGATVVALFSDFPKELVLTIAGLALLSTIGNALKVALEEENQREPALITILVSASGISLFGIGGAFWGLILGIIATLLLNLRKSSLASATA